MTNLYFLSVLVTNLIVNNNNDITLVPAIHAPREWFDSYFAEQSKHGSGVLIVHSNWIARVVVDGRTNDFTLHSRKVGQQGVTWYDRTVREWATNEWQETIMIDLSYWTTNGLLTATTNYYVTNVIGDNAFTNRLIR